MVNVIHILRDGTRLRDISGLVVKISDAEPVYNLMDHINREVVSENERKNRENN